MAQSKIWQVSAVETSRIKSLTVNLFDEVKKGQALVVLDSVLDSELMNAKLNTIKAEVARLQAELNANREILDAEAKNSRIDMVTEHRRFSADVESARLTILELIAVIEPDRILLKDYLAEINIEKELLASGAISTNYNIQKAQALHDSISLKIEKNEEFLDQARKNLEEAIKRKNEFFSTETVNPSPDIALAAISKAIDVQQQLMEEIVVEGKAIVIVSPADGVVTQITAKSGEIAIPALPILTITQTDPTEVIGYASDATHNSLKLGQRVELVKNGSTPQIAESHIVQIGPSIDLVPPRLMVYPDRPQWGRAFIVKIPPGMKLTPGEKIGIRGLHD
ncbi:MAG: HlyD family efflux transporter periplasmic adaptor subunit [Phycisphaerae bacterium]|nr:HlyD family efflux transporter periplasmic adaptor subunit [Phycisphaerae bacterium]